MFRIGGIAYSPDHILAMLDPGSPHRCADRSGANDSNTHEYLLVLHENQPSVFNARSKTRRQKKWPWRQEPGVATPPPLSAHGDQAISAKRRGAATLSGIHMLAHGDWIGWLTMQSGCEPVSAPNSLLTGKLTVNFAKSGPPSRFLCLIIARVQELTVEFPTQRNREFRVSGNVFRGTGNFNRGSSETGQPQTLGGAASKLVHCLPPRSDVRFRGQSGHC